MIKSAEEFLRLRTSQDRREYLRAANEGASEDVWLEVIDTYPEMRKWVAHNKKLPKKILDILSNDIDPNVRYMIASRRSAGEDILFNLACDPDESVRLCVACNPKVTEKILLKLLNDDWERVCEVAKEKLENLNKIAK